MFYLLSIQGQNRTGIVSDVTRLLYENQVNILDSSMTTLRSEFAMMLVVSLPLSLTQSFFSEQLQTLEHQNLSVFLKPLSEVEACYKPGLVSNYSLSVIGQDRTGIIYHFSQALSNLGADITDVNTRLLDVSEPPLYTMILELMVPKNIEEEELGQEIKYVAEKLDVDAHFHQIASIEI